MTATRGGVGCHGGGVGVGGEVCEDGGEAWCCPGDPLPGCLEADAAYVCTALAPSCFLIQKVREVSSGGGAVLNPEASVFHLPPPPPAAAATATPAPQATTTTTPHHQHTPINGYHTHVYPFMNGDVGQQYCGVCPPTSDTTGATMAVDSPVEGAAPVCPSEGSPVGDPAPDKAALSPKSPEVMTTTQAEVAVAAATSTQHEGSAAPCSPLSTPQQNGEVSPESSQPSASPQPSSPLSTPPPGTAHGGDTLPQEGTAAAPASPQEKTEEVLETRATTTAAAAGKDEASGSTEGGVAACGSETQGTQTTPAQTPTPGTPAPHTQPQPLTRDQIKQLVAQQVEYFFSRENLSNDPYLISQMDSDQYVPVYILANCSQFKNITKDHSIIVEALKESPFVQLDEENNRVRPNYKRCIVILREIPESTPVDEIEAMFKSDECPKLVSCEFVHNSSWYVTFESDEDAQKAYWYLRGVVKTFKDKPILARIKTKPMSTLRCLSVLPSYGNKGGAGGDAKEGCGTPQTPGSAGLSGNPANTAPTSSYNTPGGQRFMYSSPSSVTPNSYSYSYTTPTAPMPTAFFYPNPNMMHWTQPGGFYDINSFLQFNGLSPQAAFKPPTNHSMRYPGSRRNSKHRDGGRYDKGDGRHNSGASQGSGHAPHPGHYQRHHLRPQAPQSPSQASHRVPPNQAPVPSAPAPPVAPTPPPPPPPPPQSAAGPSGGNSHDSFAHSDFSIASQSSLYTSFSPPMGQPSSLGGEKKEAGTVTVSATTRSNSIPNQVSVPPSTTTTSSTTCNPTTNPNTTTTTPPTTSSDTHHSPSATPTAPHLIHSTSPHATPPPPPHHRHQYPLVGPPPPPPPHRGGYGDNYHHPHHPHHHMVRDPQQARQMSRGVRRRPRREEEGLGGGTGGPRGGPGQRVPGGAGGPSMLPGADTGKTNGANHQDANQVPPPPPPPPQFDLEAAAFPPLPGSDEQAPVKEEKRSSEPGVTAWGSDSQRFSDVMKGTAKPRPTSQSSLGEKEATTFDPPTPSDATPAPTQSVAPTVASAQPPAPTPSSHSASQAPSSSATHPTSTGDSSSVTTTATVTAATVTAASIAASNAAPTSAASNSSSSNSTSRGVELRSAPQRPDRRVGMGGPRERREYHREYQRDGRNSVGGRGSDHRTQRDNTRSGKENRPLAPRPSREERMDADGWITKGPKESRAQRENREQWERAEARDTRHHLVNGDSSPPPSPKPQKTEVKVSSEEACVEETKVTPPQPQPLNNNDGEHKTSWAKMALASKDEMERLASELKEKEEQEKMMKQRLSTRPQAKPQEKVIVSRERDGKLMRRDGPPRDNRMVGERNSTSFRPRDSARPKSPK